MQLRHPSRIHACRNHHRKQNQWRALNVCCKLTKTVLKKNICKGANVPKFFVCPSVAAFQSFLTQKSLKAWTSKVTPFLA